MSSCAPSLGALPSLTLLSSWLSYNRTDYIVQPEDWTLMYPETEEPANHTRFDRKWTHLVEDKEFVVLNTGAHWGDHRVGSRCTFHAALLC